MQFRVLRAGMICSRLLGLVGDTAGQILGPQSSRRARSCSPVAAGPHHAAHHGSVNRQAPSRTVNAERSCDGHTPAPGTNRAEYELRRRNLTGPLADVRGAAPVSIGSHRVVLELPYVRGCSSSRSSWRARLMATVASLRCFRPKALPLRKVSMSSKT